MIPPAPPSRPRRLSSAPKLGTAPLPPSSSPAPLSARPATAKPVASAKPPRLPRTARAASAVYRTPPPPPPVRTRAATLTSPPPPPSRPRERVATRPLLRSLPTLPSEAQHTLLDSDLIEDDTDVGVAVHSAAPPPLPRAGRPALRLVLGGVVAVLVATTSFVTRTHPTANAQTANAAQLGSVGELAARDAAPHVGDGSKAASGASLAAKPTAHAKAPQKVQTPSAKAKAKAQTKAKAQAQAKAKAAKPVQKAANKPAAKQRGAT
jgi:S-DNA-T family DNA segregation ATPase FtsK/SpoIIIE